jgi:hypothetical protein
MFKSTLLTFLFLFISCGKSSSSKPAPQIQAQEEEGGIYAAILEPLNASAHHSSGFVKVTQEGEEFKVKVSLKNGPDGIHMQHLLAGEKCPGIEQDLNKDEWIDFDELVTFSGNILIPFDNDISQQNFGKDGYPSGSYLYKEETYTSLLLSDLHKTDEVFNDHFVKLDPEDDLILEGRPVVIYGVSSRQVLPGSARGLGLWTTQQSLPIACGILQKISSNVDGHFDTNFEVPRPRPADPAPTIPPQPRVPRPTYKPTIGDRLRRMYCRITRRCTITSLSRGVPDAGTERSSMSGGL